MAGLDYAGNNDPVIRCAYCNNNIIVPEDLRSQPKAQQAKQPHFSAAMGSPMVIDLSAFSGRIGNLKVFKDIVHTGNIEAAVNYYQKCFGGTAAQAQEIANQIAAGQGVVINQTSFSSPIPVVTGTQIHTSSTAQSSQQIFSDTTHFHAKKQRTSLISSLVGFIVFIILIALIIGVMGIVWLNF